MQHQKVVNRSVALGLDWAHESQGNRVAQTSSPQGGGSWTSTANQDNASASTAWQTSNKSETASEGGDDASSVKSGSAISSLSNIPSQSQDSAMSLATSGAITSSSSPWSTHPPSLGGLDSNPWGNTSSAGTAGLGSLGWNSNTTSLSLSTNQTGNSSLQPGGATVGSNTPFNSTAANSSGGWPGSGVGSMGLPPNLNGSSQSGNMSSNWQGSTMLGNIGDFSKPESGWNPTSSMLENALSKEIGAGSWSLSENKSENWDPAKSRWDGNALSQSADQPAPGSNSELSFAKVTSKGLNLTPTNTPRPPQPPVNSRQEEILRAIENHEGWGTRPVNQSTSWETSSPVSTRKFSPDANSAGASNVWNNVNGTAIWEAVRDNSWTGGSTNRWTGDKDNQNWAAKAKPQDPNAWGVGNNPSESKGFGGTWVTSGAGDAANKMWGQKTEIGSWGEGAAVQRPTNISSWSDEQENPGWEDARRITGAGPGAMGNPNMGMVPPSPGLTSSPGIPNMMQQGMPNMRNENTPWNDTQKPGWNNLPTKMDEPWNKPPPKVSAWGEPPQDGMKVDDGTSIWASTSQKPMPTQSKPVGWNEGSQGPWNAPGAKTKTGAWDETAWALSQRAKTQMPPKFGGMGPSTQMRAKLLQQLMDLGFRKEEAQNALITNNNDVDRALLDLKASMAHKDPDRNFSSNGRMPYMSKEMDDMPDRSGQVPNVNASLPPSQYPNAQIPNQQYIQSNPPSSMNQSNSSIQQRFIQKMQPQMQSAPRSQMPQTNNNKKIFSGSQAQIQEEILGQLRIAVQNGIISNQLLYQPLPHNILVLLQQVLQVQVARANMVNKQQQLLQQPNRAANRSQIDQMTMVINNLGQQMISLQKQLQQAQNNFFSTQKPPNTSHPPSGMVTPLPGQQPSGMMDNIDALSSGLSNITMGESRLISQWKPSDDGLASNGAMSSPANGSLSDDKSKDFMQSSSPNLNLIQGGLGMTGDGTWSTISTTSSSQNWPSSDMTSSSATESKPISSSTTISSGITESIPEFVPGQPWQGLSSKSAEDDPYITPGSMHRSLSVNKVHDDSLNNLSGPKLGSGFGGAKNENSLGLSQLGARPPGTMVTGKAVGGQWQSGSTAFNRQHSWAGPGNSAFSKVGGNGGWNDSPCWILLKNLTVDANTTKALCTSQGNMTNFYFIPNSQAALVLYSSRDVCAKAHSSLNNFRMGDCTIIAEYITESEAHRYMSQSAALQQNSMPPINSSQWSQAPPTYHSGMMRGTDPWGKSNQLNKFGAGNTDPWAYQPMGGFTDMSGMGDHNSNALLGNILGGEKL